MVKHTELARDLANKILQIGDGNVSRHIDEILDGYEDSAITQVSLPFLFSETVGSIRQSGEMRTVIWISGLLETNSVNIQEKIDLDKIDIIPSKSTIYLFEGSDFMADALQEYRRTLSYPRELLISGALYRSWRSEIAERNGWEFSNDVYIWSVP